MAQNSNAKNSGTGREAGKPRPAPRAAALEPVTADARPACEPYPERRGGDNRRQSLWWAFLYGNFRPRRRSSRREADQHHFWFDWHEPRILYQSICVLLLSCIDALFTLNLLKIGATEANVVMASMLAYGVDTFVAAKIGLTSLSLLILAAVARRMYFGSFSVEHLMKLFCIGYIGVIYYEVYLFIYIFDGNLFSHLFQPR